MPSVGLGPSKAAQGIRGMVTHEGLQMLLESLRQIPGERRHREGERLRGVKDLLDI